MKENFGFRIFLLGFLVALAGFASTAGSGTLAYAFLIVGGVSQMFLGTAATAWIEYAK
jgi:hypothetical protein